MEEFTPYSFPRRLKPLQEYASLFGINVTRSGKQEEKYIVRKEGERKFSYAQTIEIAAILVEEMITEYT